MPRRNLFPATAVVLAGCAYEPSTFSFMTRPADGTRVTIGCLDLAITSKPSTDAPVLAYEFGNRCDNPAVVDLGAARVVGYSRAGTIHQLAPYDPYREIKPAWLDGRDRGRERISYPSTVALSDVCIDIAAIARESPAQWLCVRTGGS